MGVKKMYHKIIKMMNGKNKQVLPFRLPEEIILRKEENGIPLANSLAWFIHHRYAGTTVTTFLAGLTSIILTAIFKGSFILPDSIFFFIFIMLVCNYFFMIIMTWAFYRRHRDLHLECIAKADVSPVPKRHLDQLEHNCDALIPLIKTLVNLINAYNTIRRQTCYSFTLLYQENRLSRDHIQTMTRILYKHRNALIKKIRLYAYAMDAIKKNIGFSLEIMNIHSRLEMDIQDLDGKINHIYESIEDELLKIRIFEAL